MLSVRYGNRRLEMKPGKRAIEVGDLDNLVPTLNFVREAAGAGELDKLLMAAKASRVIRHAPRLHRFAAQRPPSARGPWRLGRPKCVPVTH